MGAADMPAPVAVGTAVVVPVAVVADMVLLTIPAGL